MLNYSLHIAAIYYRLHRDVRGTGRDRAALTVLLSGTYLQHAATVASEGRAADRCSLRREAARYRDITAAEHSQDDLSKCPAAETVNDEVHRRVGDDEQIADTLVEEEWTRAGLGLLTEQDNE